MGQDVIARYLPIFLFLLLAVGLGGGILLLSALLGKKRPTREKLAPYECGMTPVRDARSRFDISYYLVAMLFILFDIEVVFLYPWAVLFDRFDPLIFGFLEMVFFFVVLLFGYIYIWRKGALRWS